MFLKSIFNSSRTVRAPGKHKPSHTDERITGRVSSEESNLEEVISRIKPSVEYGERVYGDTTQK